MVEESWRHAIGRHLFVPAVLTGSFLLFLVQPMVARMALPRLGGAPAVWNSAMLVYQALLLAGYAYAHLVGRLAPRTQGLVHLLTLAIAAAWLPIALGPGTPPPDASPVTWTPWLLARSIGPLFFAVSAGAPLVQRWCALASGGRDPYALYAASNLGSFGGLLAYPLLVEPALSVRTQSWLWTAGYLLLLVLIAGCVTRLPRSERSATRAAPSAPAGVGRVGRWIVTAFVPSGLMLATSTYITTDVVAMPLLWVLPLGLYLLSWSVAFADRRGLADLLSRVAPITILLFGGVMMGGVSERPWLGAFVALTLLFMASVALHTALYRDRPAPDRLTGFYLATATGGALGGVFAALVAPVVFDWTYEYPLLILAAGLLAPQSFLFDALGRVWRTRGLRVLGFAVLALAVALLAHLGEDHLGLGFLLIAALGLASIGARLPYVLLLAFTLLLFGGYRSLALSWQGDARERSYFGVYTLRNTPAVHRLDHGTTVHGIQLRGSAERERTPTTYYARGSGVGQAMAMIPTLYGPAARVGVVGLGTGTLACYAQPGQQWRFYEIDPVVIRIAENPARFSYLARCQPHPLIRVGDARLNIAREAGASLDLLALDAFSSDTVPMHLLTEEAFAEYARVLAPSGLLLVHISNRYLDLRPVIAAAARQGGWQASEFDYRPPIADATASASWWIAMSRDPAKLATLTGATPGWKPVERRPGFRAWTDDYSTILPLVRWPR